MKAIDCIVGISQLVLINTSEALQKWNNYTLNLQTRRECSQTTVDMLAPVGRKKRAKVAFSRLSSYNIITREIACGVTPTGSHCPPPLCSKFFIFSEVRDARILFTIIYVNSIVVFHFLC